MIISVDEYRKAMELGQKIIKEGGLLVFPTDTVYGLGCDATNERAVGRIYRLKEREEGKPLAVIMPGLRMIAEWCDIGSEDAGLMADYLPGPYTFILKLRQGKTLAGLRDTVGVRVPAHSFVRKIAELAGVPIAATSANLSGKGDAWRLSDVDKGVRDGADLCIDGGETRLKAPSTVVDLVERKIVRKGAGEFAFK